METEDVARALKGVPEARLRLIELARDLVGEDGSLDFKQATFLRQELEDAIREAEGYSQATQGVVWALKRMGRS